MKTGSNLCVDRGRAPLDNSHLMTQRLLFQLITLALLTTSCGVGMTEVKREILPQIQQNKTLVETLRRDHEQTLKTLAADVTSLELAVSTLRDRLKAVETDVARQLDRQNRHLAEVDRLQLAILEQSRAYLEERLKGTRELIDQLSDKAAKPAPSAP